MKGRTTPKLGRWVDGTTTAIVLVAMAALFTSPLRLHVDLLGYAQDDFYYYLVAAGNLALGVGSTFDGTTLTNGYHPLYLVVLWGVCRFVKGLPAIFRFLAVLDTVSALSIFLAARALFARRLSSVWLTNGLALIILAICCPLLCGQMEVTLTVPLALLFLLLLERAPEGLSPLAWAGIGLVGALLILSRLDAALLVGLCGLVALSIPAYRRTLSPRKMAGFAAGFAPLLAAYLWINEVVFHRLAPISGAAKQLKTTHGFAWHALSISLSRPARAMFLLAFLALFLLPVLWRRLATEQRITYLAALLFPFVHWSLNLWLSDWQLWAWYAYSVRLSMVVVLALAGMAAGSWLNEKWRNAGQIALFAFALLLMLSTHYTLGGQMLDIAAAAERIHIFAQTHPGRYAMGDRAGMAGYLDGQPTVQLEGLMMDKAYLEHIRAQDPLREVLKLYRIDYYVGFAEKGSDSSKPGEGCFQAKEPAQAGPDSPAMRGVFCEQPVWEYLAPSGRTMIFDVRGKP